MARTHDDTVWPRRARADLMLFDHLQRHARDRPHAVAMIDATGRTWTYPEVVARSQAAARWLRERGVERFGIQTASVPDLIAMLAGAALVGVEPCAYGVHLTDEAVARFCSRFDHALLVRDDPGPVEGVTVVSIDVVALDGEDIADPPSPSAPLLVLTTGTTGEPKGARHDWYRLFRGASGRTGDPDARWLLAYNIHQFAGVQMLVHVVSAGATLVVPASNRPADALRALRAHGVTHASATPTFWRMLLAERGRSPAEDVALRQITLGGEAVGGQLLDGLKAAFPLAAVSQVYASTEFGSAVSVRDGEAGLPASVLERAPDADVRFRIEAGELWSSSRVGMLGYYGEDDDDADEAPWRPTGDRVEVRGDRIVFLGRTSDIINVGGVKVHPIPIEEIITAVPGVQVVRVFGRPNPVAGNIVAAEVVPVPGTDPQELEQAVRAACEDHLPPAARPRRVRIVDAIEVTGGKVSRGRAAP